MTRISFLIEKWWSSGGYIPRREGDSCFSIYQIRWKKTSETFAKRRAIFPSVRKTVNIQGYSELREPFKTRENCYPLIWQILIIIIVFIAVTIIHLPTIQWKTRHKDIVTHNSLFTKKWITLLCGQTQLWAYYNIDIFALEVEAGVIFSISIKSWTLFLKYSWPF